MKNSDVTQVPQEKKPVQQEEIVTPEKKGYKRSEIPELIKSLSKKQLTKLFGDLTVNPKETPYHITGNKNFFTLFGIDAGKNENYSLSKAVVHLIIVKQLQGTSKTLFDTVKTNCISYLENKVKHPVQIMYGRPVSDMQRENMIRYNTEEIARWKNEKFSK